MTLLKKLLLCFVALLIVSSGLTTAQGNSNSQDYPVFSQSKPLLAQNDFLQVNTKNEQKIDALLKQMTIDEKIGQLAQFCDWFELTGPAGDKMNIDQLVADGKVGTVLNYIGVGKIKNLQKIAVEKSRLHIPLLFGYDVIHGYKTIFPIPLAQASSFNVGLIEKSERVAAVETSAAGVNWTFAPMMDISRDPRWGRMAEGSGEDTYLGACIAAARVNGFQSKNLATDNTAILACAKHYVGYGAAEAGKDYAATAILSRQLWETYMPPFASAIHAGVGSVMPAFSDIDGVPMTANSYLIKDVLFKKLAFRGVTVSDWTAVTELVNHGIAEDNYQATKLAISAGVDIDMVSGAYLQNTKTAVEKNELKIDDVNDAVRRVLRTKFALGLFDNPYKYCNETREKIC